MTNSVPLCTYLIILGTCIFSYLGFNNRAIEEKYIFNPESILAWKEYHRILTSGFHNEGPTFAPNGRVLMFFRDPGGNAGAALYTIDLTGRNEQKVPTPSYASDPAWSPLLS